MNGRHLGWARVRAIRAEYLRLSGPPGERKQRLAREYGVSLRTVQRVIANRTWRVDR